MRIVADRRDNGADEIWHLVTVYVVYVLGGNEVYPRAYIDPDRAARYAREAVDYGFNIRSWVTTDPSIEEAITERQIELDDDAKVDKANKKKPKRVKKVSGKSSEPFSFH